MALPGPAPEDDPPREVIDELQELRGRLDELTARVRALEEGPPRAVRPDASFARIAEEQGPMWAWARGSTVLPRLATVSFALVIALVLRTLTDAGIFQPRIGVLVGIAYAVSLVLWGWRASARQAYGRRVFPICGTVLLCAVLLETDTRFQHLSAPTANLVLLATATALAWIGLRYRVPLSVEVAALATTVTSIAIGFPNPLFPYTAAVLLVANLAAWALLHRSERSWLQWAVLGLSLFFWLMWAFELHAPLSRDQAVPTGLYLEWFLPVLAIFFIAWTLLAARRVALRPAAPGAFGLALPSMSVAWAYPAALAVAAPWLDGGRWLGAVGLVASAAYLGIAHRSWRRTRSCVPGVLAFTVAATLSFAPASLLLVDDATVTVLLWAVAALGLARLSAVCGSSGVRLVSLVLQAGACILGIAAGEFQVLDSGPMPGAATAGLLALVAAVHYRWYSRTAPGERTGILLLWTALLAGICALRILAYGLLLSLSIDVDSAFPGTQSVIINASAIGLMVLGRKNRDLLTTAALVAVIGGLKVFGSDLLTTRGVPLVASVFSFGMVAAVGSIVLRRRQGPAGS